MRLSSFTIRRFKGIDELTITVPKCDAARSGSAEFLTLIGENNCSKSSVLQALLLALPGGKNPDSDLFPGRDPQNGPIEVEMEFDSILPEEQDRHGIRSHVYEGKYRIRKRWAEPGKRPAVFAYAPNVVAPELDRIVVEGTKALAELPKEWGDVVKQWGGQVKAKMSARAAAELREFVVSNHPTMVRMEPSWSENPGGIPANPESALPVVIYVPAVREADAEASPSGKGAAQQIMKHLFERALASNPAITKFNEAAAQVKALFEDGARDAAVVKTQQDLTARLKRLIDLEIELGFEPADLTDSQNLVKHTSIEVVDRGIRTTPEHQGNGAQRALILTLLELLAIQTKEAQAEDQRPRGILILVEEPEIYLHPQMCRRMRDVLVELARSGSAQVICTSHSPVFLDLADRHDGIVLLRRDHRSVRALQRSEDLFADKAEERDRLRMLLNFDPTVNEVFFASKVCLTEGDTEVASARAMVNWLKTAGYPADEVDKAVRGAAVVNCRGKRTIPAFQRVLDAFEIQYVVVHDADNEGTGGTNASIAALAQTLDRVLKHEPNFEKEIWGEDWDRDKPWKATQKITSGAVPHKLLTFFNFLAGTQFQARN